MTQKFELSEFVKHVADQIREARDTAGQDHVLKLSSCEIEMGIEVESEGKLGLKVYVFQLKGGQTRTNTNTVRLQFGPTGHIAFAVRDPGPGPALGPQEGVDHA